MIEVTRRLNDRASLTLYMLDQEISYQVIKEHPTLIICPGGSYLFRAKKESEPVALTFLARGYNVVLLNYTTYFEERVDLKIDVPKVDSNSHYPQQLSELVQTLKILKELSVEYKLDLTRLFLLGFSAGGHIAASYAVHWNDYEYLNKIGIDGRDCLKLRGILLAYPMLTGDLGDMISKAKKDTSIKEQLPYLNNAIYGTEQPTLVQKEELNLIHQINKTIPPTFLWQSLQDEVTPVSDSLKWMVKLTELNIECESHFFGSGKHGMGLANSIAAKNSSDEDIACSKWVELADLWMKRHDYINIVEEA
ncbi:alpha/beta hydrolase [Ligilactobacillus sp. WILCCON 0076]|uniref:Alpha/beta hydrolase n=1 Tax=Ligilactobacillus ubinensis TaxID=2876789 RepID=A0A9X2JMG7_9LACO|nr:alpha/beta hydrolase [Ligilactobacillus ubinensis]MCP0887086.1 alpha/beta hydrolase [Ligilactobacillus ubinensis]